MKAEYIQVILEKLEKSEISTLDLILKILVNL